MRAGDAPDPDRMTAEPFECRDICGWSDRALSRTLRVSEVQIRRWASGGSAIPTRVADGIHGVALYLVQHPAPSGCQRRSQRSCRERSCGPVVSA